MNGTLRYVYVIACYFACLVLLCRHMKAPQPHLRDIECASKLLQSTRVRKHWYCVYLRRLENVAEKQSFEGTTSLQDELEAVENVREGRKGHYELTRTGLCGGLKIGLELKTRQ